MERNEERKNEGKKGGWEERVDVREKETKWEKEKRNEGNSNKGNSLKKSPERKKWFEEINWEK